MPSPGSAKNETTHCFVVGCQVIQLNDCGLPALRLLVPWALSEWRAHVWELGWFSDRSKYLAGIEMSIEVSKPRHLARNIFICQ
jgi:hypothetical protein